MKTWYRGGGIVLAGLLTTSTLVQGAQIYGLYPTGAGGSAGGTDAHYSIFQQNSGTGLPALICGSPRNVWVNCAGASWLLQVSGAPQTGQTGECVYQLTFDLVDASGNALNPSTASLTGLLAANRYATVLLNGTTLADFSQPAHRRQFRRLVSFSLNSGFVAGTNTLDFIVHQRFPSPRRTGLLVTGLNGTAQLGDIPVVPEPKPIVLLALGLLGLLAMTRVWSSNRRTIEAVPARKRRKPASRRLGQD